MFYVIELIDQYGDDDVVVVIYYTIRWSDLNIQNTRLYSYKYCVLYPYIYIYMCVYDVLSILHRPIHL